jgi:hypothetical protein
VRTTAVHGFTTAFEVSAMLLAMAAVVAWSTVVSTREHERATGAVDPLNAGDLARS